MNPINHLSIDPHAISFCSSLNSKLKNALSTLAVATIAAALISKACRYMSE